MAHVSTAVIHDGWSGSEKMGESIPEFDVQFVVQVDDKEDGPRFILEDCELPRTGDVYANVGNDTYLGAWCKSVNVSPMGEKTWRAVAKYAGLKLDQDQEKLDEEGKTITVDPAKQGLDVSVSLVQMSKAAVKGAYTGQIVNEVHNAVRWPGGPGVKPNGAGIGLLGPGVAMDAITNSANIAFDPAPEIDYSRTAVSITRNQKKFNANKWLNYADTVNKDQIILAYPNPPVGNFFKLTVMPLTAKMQAIQVQRRVSEAGQLYWRVTFEFHIDNIFGWRAEILDRGYSHNHMWNVQQQGWNSQAAAGTIQAVNPPIVGGNGHTAAEPQMLDGLGRVKATGAPPVFLQYALYQEVDWAPLKLNRNGWNV